MKKLLITGFTPFGNEAINPAYEAVKRLDDVIHDVQIIKLEVPTSFERAGDIVINAMKEHDPDYVLCVGQAGGRAKMSFEFVAINYIHARMVDNDGKQPDHIRVREDGPDAYLTNLPVYTMVDYIKSKGIPAHVSYSAGTYVCNTLFYMVMDYIRSNHLACKMDFIHVPYTLEQTIDKGNDVSSMSLEDMKKGLHCVVEFLSKL